MQKNRIFTCIDGLMEALTGLECLALNLKELLLNYFSKADLPSSQQNDATGHCGIITGDKKTASANANADGRITINDWGFRNDNHPTIRRYRGK